MAGGCQIAVLALAGLVLLRALLMVPAPWSLLLALSGACLAAKCRRRWQQRKPQVAPERLMSGAERAKAGDCCHQTPTADANNSLVNQEEEPQKSNKSLDTVGSEVTAKESTVELCNPRRPVSPQMPGHSQPPHRIVVGLENPTPTLERSVTVHKMGEGSEAWCRVVVAVDSPKQGSESPTVPQRISFEAEAQIQKPEEKQGSDLAWARSSTTPGPQICGTVEERGSHSSFTRSATCPPRSDTDHRTLEDLPMQLRKLQEQRDPAAPHRISLDAHASSPEDEQLPMPQQFGNGGQLKSLLQSIQLPPEYNEFLADEGIDFLEDLADYGEAELMELGFKRAHAKRLLKAVATASAGPEDGSVPASPLAAMAG